MKRTKGFGGISFGVMEGLIMITGMLIGFGFSYPDKRVIILAVLTAAVADAFGNTAGFHVAEETKKKIDRASVIRGSIFCFISTLFATITPIIPMIFFPVQEAVIIGGMIAIFLMIILSIFVAKVSNRRPLPVIAEYVFYGVGAALVCFGFGYYLSILL